MPWLEKEVTEIVLLGIGMIIGYQDKLFLLYILNKHLNVLTADLMILIVFRSTMLIMIQNIIITNILVGLKIISRLKEKISLINFRYYVEIVIG